MTLNKIIITFFIIFFFPCIDIANDSALGSIGGNVFPIFGRTNIKMLKEAIYIKMFDDSCTVNCKFWFVNTGNETKELWVGFPDYFSDLSESSQGLKGFTCVVNNKSEKVEQFTQIVTPDADSTIEWYEKWFCWFTTFPPLDTVIIENSYYGFWGLATEPSRFFDYLVGTARTWNGNIGNGKVTFDYSELSRHFFLDTTIYSYSWHKLNTGMARHIYNDSVVFTFDDYLPPWNETLSVSFIPLWQFLYLNDTSQLFSLKILYSKERLRLLRNDVYARHGYVFQDHELQEYFEKQPWYRRDPEFDLSELTENDRKKIGFIKKLEQLNQ
jgi:hypothetical protein